MPRRRSFRRRHGRKRSRFHRKKSRFTRRVLRAEIANSNSKKQVFANFTANLAQGDGVSRVLTIFSPLTGLVQGTSVTNFTGNGIYPTGVRVRALVSNATSPGFQQFFIRWVFFWAKARANYGTNGTGFGNTTTVNTAPAQTSPNANPVIFDSLTGAFSPFVGDTFATPFDTTKIKIITTKTWKVNHIGAGPGNDGYKTFFRFPKRKINFEDTAESPLTSAPNYPSYGNYYLAFQVFGAAGTANISSTAIGTMDLTAYVYWKDIDG